MSVLYCCSHLSYFSFLPHTITYLTFTLLSPQIHPTSSSVGIHQRPGDLAVNVCKTKALTNMRSANKGITIGITAPIVLSLDASVEYLASDEILEVTPSLFRMAKNPAMMGKKAGRAIKK